jgi:hypothetical protein
LRSATFEPGLAGTNALNMPASRRGRQSQRVEERRPSQPRIAPNRPAEYANIEQLFNEPSDDAMFETNETVGLTGGRIETRRHTVCHKVGRMTSDRHHPGEPVFPDLAMVGQIETEVERSGKIEYQARYCMSPVVLAL